MMQWAVFAGDRSYAARGRNAVYLVIDAGATAQLYQMDPDLPLCPINESRAQRYTDIPECACGECDAQGITAALAAIAIAEKWEEDAGGPGQACGTPEPDCGATARD